MQKICAFDFVGEIGLDSFSEFMDLLSF